MTKSAVAKSFSIYSWTDGTKRSFPSLIQNWVNAKTGVAAGTRRARLLCIGDSLTAGDWSTANDEASNSSSLSYPCQMAGQFVVPAQADSWLGDNNSFGSTGGINPPLAQHDSRITMGSGWASDTTDTPTASGNIQSQQSAVSSNFSFAPAGSFDNFTLWYEKYSGSPQYTVNVDGGASLGTIPANASAAIGTFSASVAPGTHTINVASNGTAGGKLIGIESWLSAAPKIQIINAGADGWQCSDWIQNNGNAWDPLAFSTFLAPDLVLICLGKNEQDHGVSQATFQTNLNTLVAGLISGGTTSIVIFGPPLSNSSSFGMSEATQLAYETNMQAVATANHCVFYSLTQSRANWGSFAAANTAGFMAATGGGIHCSAAGYLDMAKALLTVIG